MAMTLLAAITQLVQSHGTQPAEPLADSTLALGFLLLFAFSLGQFALISSAPKITGFLIAGVVVGPYGLGLVGPASAEPLKLVNGLALCLIAFTAGGELNIERFRPRAAGLLRTAIYQFAYTLCMVFVIFLPMFHFTGILGGSLAVSFCGALLLSVVATANSPATAVAVITETRAAGPVSDTILGVTVIKDVLVVVFFGMAMGVAATVYGEGQGAGVMTAGGIIFEIAASLLAGAALGGIMIAYLNMTDRNVELFVVGVALVVAEISPLLHLDLLLLSITAGFVVENFSKSGEKLVKGIETSSAPVYVIFFSLAGQSLDLSAFAVMWPYAAFLVIARIAAIRQGTITGVVRSGESEEMARSAWSGFVSQAGVSIGLAVIISRRFPEWGPQLSALILAAIVINQLIGPIMMKNSLILAGETRSVTNGVTRRAK